MYNRWTVRTVKAMFGILMCILALLVPGTPGKAQSLSGDAPPPESLEQAPQPVGPVLSQVKPAGKLDSALAAMAVASSTTARLAEATPAGTVVHIAIAPDDQDEVRAAVARLGGEVTIASSAGDTLQAWLPLGSLAALAELPAVQMLRRPPALSSATPESSAGTVSSEALRLLGVHAWHRAGYTGRGLRIGIIENDFQGFEALLGNELPPADRVRYWNFADPRSNWGRGPYGTAQAEVLHEIAPDAILYLARVTNHLEFEQAALWMQREGVTVIGSYLGWYNLDPGDGSGFLADVVARTHSTGIVWITSAQHVREQHWGGNAFDSNGDGYLAVEGSLQINHFRDPIPPGQAIMVYLRWSDWLMVNQDIELVITRWNGLFWEEFAESTALQNGSPGQRPVESLEVVSSGPTTYYGVALRSFSVDRMVNVDVFTYGRPFIAPTFARSLLNLGDVPATITVGAVEASPPFARVSYVGEGPTNGPGGVRDGGLAKPDLVSYSGVSTTTYPERGFGGTGASVAHVTGVAALLRDAYPALGPDAVKHYLIARAIDRDGWGWDPLTGYGLVVLGSPPR